MIRVTRVLAGNPGPLTLEGTNTWIVGDAPAVVIDPGPGDPAHLDDVVREAGSVGAILVTHSHEDHADGADRLASMTGAPVYRWRPGPGGSGTRLKDGEEIRAGAVRIIALHTPGHSPDHTAFFLESGGALFTGDAVLGRGTSVIDPPEGDLAAYLRSLRRMQEVGARLIYPGHGPVVFDAAAKLQEYLEHRQDREAQVLAALVERPMAPAELVERIYVDYAAELLPLAERSVLAHLEKLEAEGRVVRTRKDGLVRYERQEPKACARCGRPVRGRAQLCGRCSMDVLQEPPAERPPETAS
jgi:glyoxylase-like metal-dependent hydrolase (beta-lactamase superfamily II)